MKLDSPIEVNADGIKYTIMSSHRNRSFPHKSIWTISPMEELKCFSFSLKNGWLRDDLGWGIKPNKGKDLDVVGINNFKENLKLAMFIGNTGFKEWHGYPADYRRNKQDRPNIGILSEWRLLGYIKKHHISKIRSGKECSL